jgi:hypothetical protein
MKDLLTAPNRFEIYVMDLEDNKEESLILGLEMKQKDAFGYFIYLDIKDNFYDAILADADYFLTKPIWPASFFSLLNKIRKINVVNIHEVGLRFIYVKLVYIFLFLLI